MKKYFLFILLASYTLFAEQWPLERCIEHALKHNKTIRLHTENITSDSAKVIQAKSVFYPDLSANANTSVSGAPFAQPSVDPSGNVSLGLSSRVTLFDAKKSAKRLSIAQKTLEQDKSILKSEIRDMISLVARSYISVLYAAEALKNADEAVSLSQKQFEYQQALKEAGMTTSLALSKSNAQLSKNKYSQTSAQNAFDFAVLQIKQLLELDSNVDFEVTDTLLWERQNENSNGIANLSADSVFEIYGNNFVSELYSGQLSVEIAQMSLDIAKAGKMPTLSANGSLSTSINSRSENSATEQLRNQISPSMGLNLSVPIVDNRSAKSSKIIAESNLNKAKISLEATRQNIRSQIEQLVADIKSAAARFVSAREQFLAETENMRIIEEMYGMGNLTVIDYASQENNFLSAQSEFTQAKYSLMLSKKLLEIYLSYN